MKQKHEPWSGPGYRLLDVKAHFIASVSGWTKAQSKHPSWTEGQTYDEWKGVLTLKNTKQRMSKAKMEGEREKLSEVG